MSELIAWAFGAITGAILAVMIAQGGTVPRSKYVQILELLCVHADRPGWKFWQEHKNYMSPEQFEICMPRDTK